MLLGDNCFVGMINMGICCVHGCVMRLPLLMKLCEYIRKASGGGDGNRLPFAGDKACPGWAVFGGVGDIHAVWVLWIKLDRYSI